MFGWTKKAKNRASKEKIANFQSKIINMIASNSVAIVALQDEIKVLSNVVRTSSQSTAIISMLGNCSEKLAFIEESTLQYSNEYFDEMIDSKVRSQIAVQQPRKTEEFIDLHIQKLGLPRRVTRPLLRSGIFFIRELKNKSESQVLHIRGIGETGLAHIIKRLGRYDLILKKERKHG